MTIDPDETGFDARLRALAGTIIDEEVPDGESAFDRDWNRDALFTAMQANAALKGMTGTPNDMAACETLGRAWVRVKTTVA